MVSTANYVRESLELMDIPGGWVKMKKPSVGVYRYFPVPHFLRPKGSQAIKWYSHGKFGRHERNIRLDHNCQFVLLTCSIGLWRILMCTDFDCANLLAML